MPDLFEFLTFGPHRGLRQAYDRWIRCGRPRGYNVGEEKEATFDLLEMLARETRIWVLSELLSKRQPFSGLDRLDKPDFGKDMNLLEELKKRHPVLNVLAGSLSHSRPNIV